MTKTMESPAPVAQRETDASPLEGVGTHQAVEQQYYDREFDDIVARYMAAETLDDIENTRTALTTSLAMPVHTHETPQPTTPVEAIEEHETAEPKKSFLRRSLGRLSLSRLGAHANIAQMNVVEAVKNKNEALAKKNEVEDGDNRRTRARKWLGRHGLKLAAGGMAGLAGLTYAGMRMKYGLEAGGVAHHDVATAAVIKPLDPNAPTNPIFVGGHTQGQSNVMPNAARQAGVAGFNGAPRVARYNAEIGRIIPGEGQTWDQSGEQAKQAILAQARPNDTVVTHSQGATGGLMAAAERPDLHVRAIGTPYTPGSGLLANESVANGKGVSPILKAFGVTPGNPGPKDGSKIIYDINDGGAAHGGRGTGDVWTATVDPDGTINPVRALSNGLGTAYLGTHELDAHSGTPYAITKNADGSTTRHFNSGTRVINPMTGKPYESGITAAAQKQLGIATPANLDRAAKLAEGDANGNVNARAVGDAIAPGVGNFTAPFQGLADASKPIQRAISNPTPESINTAIGAVTKGLGGAAPVNTQGGGNTLMNTVNQTLQGGGKKTDTPVSVNAKVNIPTPVPVIPNIPTPQQVQADPAGAAMNFIGGLLGGPRR